MQAFYEEVIFKLEHAQCNTATIQRCHKLLQDDCISDCICLLTKYRKDLAATMDIQCKRIDCIDYLIYKLESSSDCMR